MEISGSWVARERWRAPAAGPRVLVTRSAGALWHLGPLAKQPDQA